VFASECPADSPVDILISHLHIDHTIGLSMFAPIWKEQNNIRIFTKSRDSRPLAAQVFGIFKPPYWPVDAEKMNHAQMIEINSTDSFMLSEDIKVIPMRANHDNDAMLFRIEAGGKSFVYLLDNEVDDEEDDIIIAPNKLVNFCKNADLIIFDGAYLPEDYPKKRGWGHSHYRAGIHLAEMSGCKRMIFSHFSPEYTDDALDRAAAGISGINNKYYFAYDGMEVNI
jgi:ribonuclease BN (tRNA processing enzyme)